MKSDLPFMFYFYKTLNKQNKLSKFYDPPKCFHQRPFDLRQYFYGLLNDVSHFFKTPN